MRYLVTIALTLMLALPVAAQDSQKANEAHEKANEAAARGDYATVFRVLFPFAEQGHARAQFGMGRLYYHGAGVSQSYTQAAMWWRRSAEQGYTKSQFNLGDDLGRQRRWDADLRAAVDDVRVG